MKHQGQFGIHIDKLGVKRLVVLLTIPIMTSWHNGNLVYTCEPLALTEKQHLKGVWEATVPQFNSTRQFYLTLLACSKHIIFIILLTFFGWSLFDILATCKLFNHLKHTCNVKSLFKMQCICPEGQNYRHFPRNSINV